MHLSSTVVDIMPLDGCVTQLFCLDWNVSLSKWLHDADDI